MTRTDLLELTPAALTALANAGFVKRAQKDVAAGLLPQLEHTANGTIVARFADGTTTHLPPGCTLADAECTCPASGMCRHRVMLVLAYQHQQQATQTLQAEDTPWNPAHFDDAQLAACLSPGVLAQAAQMAATGPMIGLTPWRSASQPPTARLPMCTVQFFSRTSLAHARCDCKANGGCAHMALAVWAFRQAPALAEDALEVMLPLSPIDGTSRSTARLLERAAAQTARSQLEALLLALWLDGSSQPLLALSARLAALRTQVQALDWNWVDDALDELGLLLHAQHARSSRFDAGRLLAVVAELWARLHAAAHVDKLPPDATPPRYAQHIVGIGVAGEVALEHLRLVSLGAMVWADEDNEGIDIVLADPDSQSVTLLERNWPRALNSTPDTAPTFARRRIANTPVQQFAAAQIVTKTAIRRANGRIDIKSSHTRQTSVLPLSPTAWDELQAPLCQSSVRALQAQWHSRLPDFVLPRQAAGGSQGALHILAGSAQQPLQPQACQWNAATQTLHATLQTHDTQDLPLHIALPHRNTAPAAVDALARVWQGQWGALHAVAGITWLAGGQMHMQPLAVLTAQRAIALQLEAAAPQALQLAPDNASGHHSPLIQETYTLLTQWLRQGLRHQGGHLAARIQSHSKRLQQAGLPRCASLLQAIAPALHSSERSMLLVQLSTLILLLGKLS